MCFPFKLAYILGFCDSPEPSDGSSNGMWHPHHPDANGLTSDWSNADTRTAWMSPGGTYIARDPIDVFRMVPKTIVVMTNIVRPSIVGTTPANVLKVLPVPMNREDSLDHGSVSMVFKNLEYFEVAVTELNEISFKLLSVKKDGKMVPVEYCAPDADAEIFIRLHFRRVVALDQE